MGIVLAPIGVGRLGAIAAVAVAEAGVVVIADVAVDRTNPPLNAAPSSNLHVPFSK